MNKTQFWITTLVFIIGALLGFQGAEAWVVGTVSKHDIMIADLSQRTTDETTERKNAEQLIAQGISDDRVHYDKAMTELLVHMDKVIDQNTALMAELKAQRRVDP